MPVRVKLGQTQDTETKWYDRRDSGFETEDLLDVMEDNQIQIFILL